jgi:hypothetical protein
LNSLASHLYPEELYNITTPIVVIIPKAWHKFLEEEKALLAKILGSVKVNIDSVIIVVQQNVSLEPLLVFNPGKVLNFGVPFQGDTRFYENVVINGINLINADELSKLDDAKKKNLWIALKQMFSV